MILNPIFNISSISNIAVLLFVFYMLIAVNFLPDLIGCQFKQVLHSSMIAKHTLGLVLLFFLVTIGNQKNIDQHIIYNIFLTIIVYIWFIITTRSPFILAIIIIILLIILYILNKKKERLLNDKNFKKIKYIENIQKIILLIAIILSFIGFIIYIIERKLEHGDNFSYFKFIIGQKDCTIFRDHAKILSI